MNKDTAQRSGFSVSDVQAGKAGWTHSEVDEFLHWMDNDAALNAWLRTEFEAFDREIKAHPLWSSDFILDD